MRQGTKKCIQFAFATGFKEFAFATGFKEFAFATGFEELSNLRCLPQR